MLKGINILDRINCVCNVHNVMLPELVGGNCSVSLYMPTAASCMYITWGLLMLSLSVTNLITTQCSFAGFATKILHNLFFSVCATAMKGC